MMSKKILTLMMFILVSLAGTACGGGDSAAPQTPEQGSSNWDELVWDQDNWG